MGVNWSELQKTRQDFRRIRSWDTYAGTSWQYSLRFLPKGRFRILDVGCNDCKYFGLLKNKNLDFEGVGYDIDKTLQEKVRGYKVYSDLQDVSRNEGKFDVITMWEVLEHMGLEEAERFMGNIKGLLKGSGLLLVSTPNIYSQVVARTFWEDLTHVKPYPAKDTLMFFKGIGFSINNVSRLNRVPLSKLPYSLLAGSDIYTTVFFALGLEK